MQPSSDSYSNEINVYEERLKINPASYCFAALAELYLKAGQADDALSVARTGVVRYPAFVAGQMALARICQQQGLTDEALQALAVVTTAVPESLEAQRMFAQFSLAAGRQAEAMQALRSVLEFYPDDKEIQAELAEFEKSVWDGVAAEEDDLELIELSDEDLIPDLPDEPFEDELVVRSASTLVRKTDPWDIAAAAVPVEAADTGAFAFEADQQAVDPADPMLTATVAELYRSQGFADKARDIYQALLARDPADAVAAAGLASLEQQTLETAAAVATQAALPGEGSADHGAVAVLEGWLENIRRLQSCR